MIMDLLKNWRNYTWPNERFAAGFAFLEAMSDSIADGTHEIDGKNVYCMVQAYDTKPAEGHEIEAHREYADIQLVMDGCESILWAPQEGLTVTKPYVHDIEFYALTPSPADLVLSPGQFAVFMPQDGHAPCIAHGIPGPVRKAVVKVKL